MASGIINTANSYGFRPQYVHRAWGTSGQTGYVKICRIVVLREYANAPLRFAFAQRARPIAEISIVFENENSTDPSVRYFIYDCPQEELSAAAFLYKASTSTWDLYIQKLDAYDDMEVVSFDYTQYLQGNQFSLTWTDEQRSTALSWTVTATKGYQYVTAYTPTRGSVVDSIGAYTSIRKVGRLAVCSFNFHVNTASTGATYLSGLPVPIQGMGCSLAKDGSGLAYRFFVNTSGQLVNDGGNIGVGWYNGSVTYVTAS